MKRKRELSVKDHSRLCPKEIRTARTEAPEMRERDLADKIGITESELLAAHTGHGVTRIEADIDRIIPAVMDLGSVMGLTRNPSCVIEKVGQFEDFRPGPHAALVVNEDIDLRMFPRHWVHGFAVEKDAGDGLRRSLQVFDAAGDAVHKVFLRPDSRLENWDRIVQSLRLAQQDPEIDVAPRAEVEPAKGDPDNTDRLRGEWDKLTDTHQFHQIVRKLKMNRLGAYRMAGAPYVRQLDTSAVFDLLHKAADTALPIMVFVGNNGCIEIHTGPIDRLKPMGRWFNVLDPGFNLHLRADHIAEVWQVTKSTRRGDAVSVEAFDSDGALITQYFGVLPTRRRRALERHCLWPVRRENDRWRMTGMRHDPLHRRALLICLCAVSILAGARTVPAVGTEDRIVSIGGSVTEIVAALGEGHRLFGRDTTSNHPPHVLDLPDVGYIRQLSPEGVLSVNPHLILAEEGAGPPTALDALRASSVRIVEIPMGFDAPGGHAG